MLITFSIGAQKRISSVSPMSTILTQKGPTISICPPPLSPIIKQAKNFESLAKTEPDLINLESTKSSPVLSKSDKISDNQITNNLLSEVGGKLEENLTDETEKILPQSPISSSDKNNRSFSKNVSFLADKTEESDSKYEEHTESSESRCSSEFNKEKCEGNNLMKLESPEKSSFDINQTQIDDLEKNVDESSKSLDSQSEDEEIMKVVGTIDDDVVEDTANLLGENIIQKVVYTYTYTYTYIS